MQIEKLKSKIISEIQKSDNLNLISEIYEIIRIESDEVDPYIFSNEQEIIIKEAQKQVNNGQYLSNSEAQKDFQEWLKK
jgi:hypothetical protein